VTDRRPAAAASRRLAAVVPLALLAAAAVLALACAPQDPAERVARLRSQYQAELTSFVVRKPEPPEPVAVPEETAGEQAAEPVAPEPAIEELPTTSDVVLDILLSCNSREPLAGLTVDVSHVGAARQEKRRHRVWVDTGKLGNGAKTQVSHVLEDIDYEEGDGFHVEVRRLVPAGERGDYPEFSGAG
jgi:hypothetical protein